MPLLVVAGYFALRTDTQVLASLWVLAMIVAIELVFGAWASSLTERRVAVLEWDGTRLLLGPSVFSSPRTRPGRRRLISGANGPWRSCRVRAYACRHRRSHEALPVLCRDHPVSGHQMPLLRVRRR